MKSFVERIKLNASDSIVLYSATNHDGRKFFAYIRCNMDGIRNMQKDYELRKPVDDIQQYGKVIYIDFKSEPDSTAIRFLEKYILDNQ